MHKIHVDTNALAESRPAILVVPEQANNWPLTKFVAIHCPCCNARAATVEQHGNNAHVIVPRIDQVTANPEETP